MHEEPIDIAMLRQRWWSTLVQIDEFLANDAPDEALARARALRAEAAELFARRPDLDRSELRELSQAARLAIHRARRARREWAERAVSRARSFQARELDEDVSFTPPSGRSSRSS